MAARALRAFSELLKLSVPLLAAGLAVALHHRDSRLGLWILASEGALVSGATAAGLVFWVLFTIGDTSALRGTKGKVASKLAVLVLCLSFAILILAFLMLIPQIGWLFALITIAVGATAFLAGAAILLALVVGGLALRRRRFGFHPSDHARR